VSHAPRVRLAALAAAALLLAAGLAIEAQTHVNGKVLVLGFDGLDHQVLTRLMSAGKLPHFKTLSERGELRLLETSVPPLTAVAWAGVSTGTDPGGHTVFDLVHRDPDTMVPYASLLRLPRPAGTRPLASAEVSRTRHGQPFWEILAERGVPTTVVRMPSNFPPGQGMARQLSSMGTPDLRETFDGVSSFFTDESPGRDRIESGRGLSPISVVRVVDHEVRARLIGPRDQRRPGTPPAHAEFTVRVDPDRPAATIVLDGRSHRLAQGEWTPWLPVRFAMTPAPETVPGIVQFYLKQVRPHFKLYASPVNVDPAAPALPVSHEDAYARELATAIGPFHTHGMPHDTKALVNGLLDDAEFLRHAATIFEEHVRMFEHELARFSRGVLFFYTERVDQLAHVFWHTMDTRHPLHDPAGRHGDVIEQIYRDADRIVGRALAAADERTTLVVMSDHGFAPFYRAFDPNTWLQGEGYLARGGAAAGSGPFAGVDWSRTRAYAVGLHGLYVNLRGREKHGIVAPGAEREALIDEIARKLVAVTDPRTGERPVLRAYKTDHVYRTPSRGGPPDLVVGYNWGYRASWAAVRGGFAPVLFEDNRDKWSADHAVAAELVPGVLMTSRKLRAARPPGLYDLAPTILNEFGIPKGPAMIGQSLF